MDVRKMIEMAALMPRGRSRGFVVHQAAVKALAQLPQDLVQDSISAVRNSRLMPALLSLEWEASLRR